jgi:hypothetical protein
VESATGSAGRNYQKTGASEIVTGQVLLQQNPRERGQKSLLFVWRYRAKNHDSAYKKVTFFGR